MSAKTVRWVEEPKMGLFERMYLPAIAQGIATTVRHILKPQVKTEQYPEQEPKLPANYRGVHRLNRDDDGRVRCVACYMCATACQPTASTSWPHPHQQAGRTARNTPRRSSSTNCVASIAACARKLARSMRSN